MDSEHAQLNEGITQIERRWTMASGEGRLDHDGVEWFACDPYPYWYRWEGDNLIERGFIDVWPDEQNGRSVSERESD